jgi:hypothetical protein
MTAFPDGVVTNVIGSADARVRFACLPSCPDDGNVASIGSRSYGETSSIGAPRPFPIIRLVRTSALLSLSERTRTGRPLRLADSRATAPLHRQPGLRITGACPRDAPEPPSTASDCHLQQLANMKVARALNPASNARDTLVMCSSAAPHPVLGPPERQLMAAVAMGRRAAGPPCRALCPGSGYGVR